MEVGKLKDMQKNFNRIYIGIVVFVTIVVVICLICVHSKNDRKDNVENNISSVLPEKSMQSNGIKNLLCENFDDMYTYEDLKQDLKIISMQYSEYVKVKKLCTTCDGREVIDIVVSGPNAMKSIFINGGTHANEYISSQLVVKQLINFLDALKNNEKYNGASIKDLLSSVEIHVVPMINPDGITLCQKGLSGIKNENIADMIRKIAQNDGEDISSEYFHTWKANAQGIDINRNYPANWTTYNECNHPSSDLYKGTSIASTYEAKAIMDLTLKQKFVRAISYHTQGRVVYCLKINNFVKLISSLTGYDISVQGSKVDPAYSDWTERDLSMKSVTVELGSGRNPLPQSQFNDMWKENQYVWFATLLDLQENGI